MPQAVAIPLITALAPSIIGAVGGAVGGKKQEVGYSSGLDQQSQQFRNFLMSYIQGQASKPQSNDAQQFLYKHFGLGTVPTQSANTTSNASGVLSALMNRMGQSNQGNQQQTNPFARY